MKDLVARYDISIGVEPAMMVREGWEKVVLASDYDKLKAENDLLRGGKTRPTGWATIRNGKVFAVGPVKPPHPGAVGWTYWEGLGFTPPMPLYLGAPELSKAVIAGLMERARQKGQEGCTDAHDDMYTDGQLARAAGCLALKAAGIQVLRLLPFWPWDRKWLKKATPYRDLEKAFALILAEMERRDRMESESTV